MGKLKHRLLFAVLTSSAYISPILMVISLWTNYWLLSIERMIIPKEIDTTQLLPSSTFSNALKTTTDMKRITTTYNSMFPPMYRTTANYGLWESCKKSEIEEEKVCEFIKYFQGSDSENYLTDTIKGEVGKCLITFLFACILMIVSIFIHSYALIKKNIHYFFLISGCLFIFAGLASLTGLIVFIAAVNGAVDSKLTLNNSKEEEPVFQYNYGVSFYCAVCSFLFQELNGICNIYWYMGRYRKYRLKKMNSQQKLKYSSSNKLSLNNNSHDFTRKPSMQKIATTILASSIVNEETIDDSVHNVSQTNEIEDRNTLKVLPFIRTSSLTTRPKKVHKTYLTSKFKEKANLVKMVNKIALPVDENEAAGKKLEDTSNKDTLQIPEIKEPQIVITQPSIPKVTLVEPKKEPETFEVAAKLSESSITDTISYSSTSSIESSASSSKITPSSLSSQSSVSVVASSDEPHQLHKICSHQIKALKDKLETSRINNPSVIKQHDPTTKKIKQISIEEDELKAKFYRLKLDKKESENDDQLKPKPASSLKSHIHQANVNSHVYFRDLNDNCYLMQRPNVCEVEQPTESYYNLNNQQLSNQPCLYAPTLSIKDICSKTKLGNEYPNICSQHSQEINKSKIGLAHYPPIIHNQQQPDDYQYEYMSHTFQHSSNSNPNSLIAMPNIITNPIMANNQPKYKRQISHGQHHDTNPTFTACEQSMNRKKAVQPEHHHRYYCNKTPVNISSRCTSLNYQNLNEQISYQPRDINNYQIHSQIIPILKQKHQQPVSLHMANAANAANQAAENYMNFKRAYNTNTNYMQHRIMSRLNDNDKENYFYYLSNTLPNLFEPDMKEQSNYMNYENSNKTDQQRLHRINKRLDYEAAVPYRNTCTYDYMPVTKFLEESTNDQQRRENGRVSRSMKSKKTFKRTTSV